MRPAFHLLALSSIALFGVACKNTKTAQSDPYNTPQTYGGTGADPYASEYDNVYDAGGGQGYGNASTYSGGSTPSHGGSTPSYGNDAYYQQDSTPSYSAPSGGGYSSGSYSSGGGSSASAGTTHTVQKGDTLFNISRRYGTSVSAIQGANGINGDLIRIGERLVIP